MTVGRATLDPEAVKAAARADYDALRQIARDRSLSVAAAGAAVDAEVDRRTLAHVAGMLPDQAAEFIKIYNGEYNRLVMEKLQGNTGCAFVAVLAFLAATTTIYSAFAGTP